MYLDVIGWLNSLYTIVSRFLFPTNSYVIRKKKAAVSVFSYFRER